MCGIIALYVGKEPEKMKERLFKRLDDQETRGTDSYGVVVYRPLTKKFSRLRTLTREQIEKSKFWDTVGSQEGDFVLFHHRMATSTEVIAELGHPFINEDQTISLIHNGIVYDYMKEAEKLMEKGHKFETEHVEEKVVRFGSKSWKYGEEKNINDSEVLLHAYEDVGFDDDFYRFGCLAVIVIDGRKEKMFFTKNSNPLTYDRFDDGTLLFSSEKGQNPLGYCEVLSVDTKGMILVEKEKDKVVSSFRDDYGEDWEHYSHGGCHISLAASEDAGKNTKEEILINRCEWCGDYDEVTPYTGLGGNYVLCEECAKNMLQYSVTSKDFDSDAYYADENDKTAM